MSDIMKSLGQLEAMLGDNLREIRGLRTLLWAHHPCNAKRADAAGLYCDGPDCGIAFLTDPLPVLEQKLQQRSLAWLARAQWNVCATCGVQRFTFEAARDCPGGGAHQWIHRGESHDSQGESPDADNAMEQGQAVNSGTDRAQDNSPLAGDTHHGGAS